MSSWRHGEQTNSALTAPLFVPQYDATTVVGLVKWETLFSGATAATDVTLPSATKVLLAGCGQAGGAVSVRSIAIPYGSAVRAGAPGLRCGRGRRARIHLARASSLV